MYSDYYNTLFMVLAHILDSEQSEEAIGHLQ